MAIDTLNKFVVASVGDRVAVLRPPSAPISREDALLLAAYLVALAGPNARTDFALVLDAVESA